MVFGLVVVCPNEFFKLQGIKGKWAECQNKEEQYDNRDN